METTKERFETLVSYVEKEIQEIAESLEKENETYTDIVDRITYEFPIESKSEYHLNEILYNIIHTKAMNQAIK